MEIERLYQRLHRRFWSIRKFHARFPDGSTALIQVSVDISEPVVYKREVRSLVQAHSEFPHARCQLLVLEPPYPPVELPDNIELWLAREWLLEPIALP